MFYALAYILGIITMWLAPKMWLFIRRIITRIRNWAKDDQLLYSWDEIKKALK